MDWTNIVSAVLAGGIAGQLVTLFGGSWLTDRREHKKWLVSERYKLFSEMLSVVTYIPKKEDDRNIWTYKIRDISLRTHVLFEGGTAPSSLADAMEQVFQLARAKKDGNETADWSNKLRDAVRIMRQRMAENLDA